MLRPTALFVLVPLLAAASCVRSADDDDGARAADEADSFSSFHAASVGGKSDKAYAMAAIDEMGFWLFSSGAGDGQVYESYYDGYAKTFTPWRSIGGHTTQAVAASFCSNDGLRVFARGDDGQVWVNFLDWSNGNPHGWTQVPGGLLPTGVSTAHAPAVTCPNQGEHGLHLFAVGTDGQVYEKVVASWTKDGAVWGAWNALPPDTDCVPIHPVKKGQPPGGCRLVQSTFTTHDGIAVAANWGASDVMMVFTRRDDGSIFSRAFNFDASNAPFVATGTWDASWGPLGDTSAVTPSAFRAGANIGLLTAGVTDRQPYLRVWDAKADLWGAPVPLGGASDAPLAGDQLHMVSGCSKSNQPVDGYTAYAIVAKGLDGHPYLDIDTLSTQKGYCQPPPPPVDAGHETGTDGGVCLPAYQGMRSVTIASDRDAVQTIWLVDLTTGAWTLEAHVSKGQQITITPPTCHVFDVIAVDAALVNDWNATYGTSYSPDSADDTANHGEFHSLDMDNWVGRPSDPPQSVAL